MQIKNLAGQTVEQLDADDFFDVSTEEQTIVPFELDDDLEITEPVSAEDVEKAESMLREMLKKSADDLLNNNNNNQTAYNTITNNNTIADNEVVIVYDQGEQFPVLKSKLNNKSHAEYTTTSQDRVHYTTSVGSKQQYITVFESNQQYTTTVGSTQPYAATAEDNTPSYASSVPNQKSYVEGVILVDRKIAQEKKIANYTQSESSTPYCCAY